MRLLLACLGMLMIVLSDSEPKLFLYLESEAVRDE